MARIFLEAERPAPGVWSRAAAVLGRQALEQALSDLWRRVAPGVDQTPIRAQLICFRGLLGDGELGARVEYLWWILTRACHHHPYELDPTAEEVEGWLDEVAVV
ncbi:MAG TPA: hypothetical protein VNO79_17820, partial [Actinomycetota bacterium]|nr:hypothetical protein [Actinomycetota bacterium]